MSSPDSLFGATSQTLDSKGYVVVAAIALLAGAFFRFWDLGGAPLAVDEYFFGTSIVNIVKRGLPEFACGGFYTRGVLIQYFSVPILWLGASLEFTVRFWPAVTSLLSIIAVWCLAKLAGGTKVAAVAVILVSLSVWEVEFARFGRMYSPFQAVFLWYVYFQILHLVRGNNKARWTYMALSAVSIFVFAGASFLLVFNFLPLVWAEKRWSTSHLIAATLLLVFGVAFFLIDFRHLGVPLEAVSPMASDAGASLPINIPPLPDLILPVVVLGIVIVGYLFLRYRSGMRMSHPSWIYWLFAVTCFSFGLFGLGLTLVFAGLLLRIPFPLSENTVPKVAVAFWLLVAMIGAWLGTLTVLFAAGDGLWSSVKSTLTYMFDYPDVYHYVARPWFQAIPVTTVLLTLFSTPQLCILVRSRSRQSELLHVQRYVVATLFLLIMLSALFYQPYAITRYTYFLYPLLLIFVSISITTVASRIFEGHRLRAIAVAALILLLFGATEDFRLAHLIRINEPEIRFRTAYEVDLAGHYYTRWDYRSAAFFVNERAAADDSIIVFDQPLPHYLNRTSGIFIPEGSTKESMVSGCGGRSDIWSNAPLLGAEALHNLITNTTGKVWLIVRTSKYRWRNSLESSLPEQYGLEPEYETKDGHLAVYRLDPHNPSRRFSFQHVNQSPPTLNSSILCTATT